MLYFALFPGRPDNAIDEAALLGLPNRLGEILPDAQRWATAVFVADIAPGTMTLYADAERQQVAVILDGLGD
jgi:hypothetical protein